MKIFVTGATGYVGHQLALTLAERGNDVNILVRDCSSANVPRHKNIHVFPGDITNKHSITGAIRYCEQVYHAAASVKIFANDADVFQQVNVQGTENILSKSLEAGVSKFVFTSSCGVIGPSLNLPLCENDPRIISFDNDYEYTKFLAEKLVNEYSRKGLPAVTVALSKVYGPGIETHPISVNKVINKFIKGDLTFIPKPGTLTTNYCFIDDVVEGHILAMDKGVSGEKYILGGENISFADLFNMIRSLSGTKAKLLEAPKYLVKIWALLQWVQYKIANKEPYVTSKAIRQIFCNKIFTSEKAVQQLGYRLTPLKDGLQQTIQFLKTKNHA